MHLKYTKKLIKLKILALFLCSAAIGKLSAVTFTDPVNNFVYTIPFGSSTTVTVFVNNPSPVPTPVSIISSAAFSPYAGFMTLIPSNFTAPAFGTVPITVLINTSMFVSNPGYQSSYNNDVLITSSSSIPPLTIFQTMTVLFSEPQLQVTPTVINVTMEKNSTKIESFTISNTGFAASVLNWNAANIGPITLSQNSGTLIAPNSVTINATINSTTLPLGLTTQVINVNSPDVPVNNTIPVTFNITVIPPQISIVANPTTIDEGQSTTFTVSRQNLGTVPLTVLLNLSGSSTFNAGSDLSTPVQSTVTIPVAANSFNFTQTAALDCKTEGTESFTYTIANSPNYSAVSPVSASVVINDTDTAAVLTFTANPNPVDEGQSVVYTITRSGASLVNPLTVNLSSSGSAGFSAPADLGIPSLPSSIVIPASQASASLTFSPVADLLTEGTETFTLTIQPGSCYIVPPSPSLTVSINDTSTNPVPALTVITPTPINAALQLGQTGTATLCISNTGQPNSVLNYNLADIESWITGFSPASGAINAGDSICITVSLSALPSDLQYGNSAPLTYCGLIEIYSNDPNYSMLNPALVPVCLTVTAPTAPGGNLSVASNTHIINNLCPNHVRFINNQVLNTASGYVNWTAISFDPNITVLPPVGSTPNGGPTPIVIQVTSFNLAPNNYVGQIRIQNNDNPSDFELIEVRYTVANSVICAPPGRHIQVQQLVTLNAPPCTTVNAPVQIASVGNSTLTVSSIQVPVQYSSVLSAPVPSSFSMPPATQGLLNFTVNTCNIPVGSCYTATAFVNSDDSDIVDQQKMIEFIICVSDTGNWDVNPKSYPITQVMQGTGASVSGTIQNLSNSSPLTYSHATSASSTPTTAGFTSVTNGNGTLAPLGSAPLTYNFFAGIAAQPAVYFRGVVFFNTVDGTFRFVSIPIQVIPTPVPPQISVNPLSFTVYVNPGGSLTYNSLVISNVAASTVPLLAQVDASTLPFWLSTNTSQQIINANNSVSLPLNFDASTISVQNTYCATFNVLAANDFNNPVVPVQACMVVTNGGPLIGSISPISHTAPPETVTTLPLQICSTGTFPLEVSNITSTLPWVTTSATSLTILPGDCTTLTVSVNTNLPVCPGVYNGSFTISSNAQNSPTLNVPYTITVTGGNFNLNSATLTLQTYAGGISQPGSVILSNIGTTTGSYVLSGPVPFWMTQQNPSGSLVPSSSQPIGFIGNATTITSNTTLTQNLSVNVSNPCQPSLPLQVILDVCGRSYDLWLSQSHSALTGPSALPLADPDGDGWSNAVEYAMGMNPMLNNANLPSEPRFNVVSISPGVVQTTATFTLQACEFERGAFQFQLQVSTDLINWTPVNIGTPTSTVNNLSTYNVVYTGGAVAFFRFVVTLP